MVLSLFATERTLASPSTVIVRSLPVARILQPEVMLFELLTETSFATEKLAAISVSDKTEPAVLLNDKL